MARLQDKDEYADRVDDDRKATLALGKNLRKARAKAKTTGGEAITFDWLSKVTTLHHSSIRRFEKGEVGMTVANLIRLKDALGCSWDDLLEGCASDVVKARRPRFRK